jgi:hypothetical protein
MTGTTLVAQVRNTLLDAFGKARDEYADIVASDVAFGDWMDAQAGLRYVADIRQATAWFVTPDRIAATAGRAGIAADLLDRAAGRAQVDGWTMPDTAEIFDHGLTAVLFYG